MSAQTPDATEAEDDFDLSDVNGRMCIVTRESGSPETLCGSWRPRTGPSSRI